jgi:hypothetical protein
MNRIIIVIIAWLFYIPLTAEVKIPRLSPLPIDIEKNNIPLSGEWLFNSSPEDGFWKNTPGQGWHSIDVPGEWVMQGFKVKKGIEAAYSRTFNVSSDWGGKRIKLRCNGVYSESRIFINGKQVGSHLGGFTPFELDVTEAIQFGKSNTITLGVKSESVADSTSNASKYAVHALGGITRDLFLYALPDVNLSSFHVTTTFDSCYIDSKLTVQVEIANESQLDNKSLSLHFSLVDTFGRKVDLVKPIEALSLIHRQKKSNQTISFDIKAPEKWNSENPYLYTIICQLKQGAKTLHTTQRKIGFRQIEVRGNELFVNNMPVKLRGVCRHEVMPLRGRSVNGNIWKQDVDLFRQGNVNYIRTSHYPPDEALLEACDELGMFVEVEAPFCWAHETKVPDEKHYKTLVNQHIEMVNRDRSHPSVLIWSLGNESNLYNEYFKKAGEIIKEMDPTRPRIFSQWGPDADNNELEIGNHHYPGPEGPEKYKNSKRPVIFDEFSHLNAYNRLELAADPGLRTMWGDLFASMWDAMYRSKGVLGGAIWAGIDDTFFLPGGRAVGYGTWGPIDGWRREKPEYWGMKKAYSPVKIKQIGNKDMNGKVDFEIENQHNFTNLSACTIQWEMGELRGNVISNLAPRKDGLFSITLPKSITKEPFLFIKVISPLGYVIDEYQFQIQPEIISKRDQKKVKLRYSESSNDIKISLSSKVYEISKHNGLIKGLEPTLMILPLNAEGRGIQMLGEGQNFDPYTPTCENWVASSIESVKKNDGVEIKVSGSYKEAEGELIYYFKTTGEVVVSYDFKLLKAISPRQIGLVLTLPIDYSRLNWKRKGFWSFYPKNHIGALEGVANMFNPTMSTVGLAGPDQMPSLDWSFDQTAAGSNIFRSTKENIYEARLQNLTNKESLTVLSDGTQSIRCWKDVNQVKILIADYNNAGSERFLTSHAKRDYRPLRHGDRVKGKFTFIHK